MANVITRRSILAAGAGIAALSAGAQQAFAQSTRVTGANVAAPNLPIESGATLRLLRPVRFVQPDEDVFRANAAKFTAKTGVQVRVDFVGWEDITQQTAVTANTGAGPDIIIGFSDGPHIFAQKLIELTDVADYLVGRGVPFRRAHEIVGALVRKLVGERREFGSLSLQEWQAASDRFEPDIAARITARESVAAKRTPQSTAPAAVEARLAEIRHWLDGV